MSDERGKKSAIFQAADSLRGHFDIQQVQTALENLMSVVVDERDQNRYHRVFNRKSARLIQSVLIQVSANLGIRNLLVLNQTREYIPNEIFDSLKSQLEITSPSENIGFTEGFSSFGKHPFVVGFFGFQIRHQHESQLESSLFQSLQLARQIEDGGLGLFMFPGYGNTFLRNDAVSRFAQLGLTVSAIIRTPKGFFPGSAIMPLMVLVTKQPSNKTFILDANHFESIDLNLSNYFEEIDTGEIQSGIWRVLSEFAGFEAHLARAQMAEVSKGFERDYREILIEDVALAVTRVPANGLLDDETNSVFIPISGNSPVGYSSEEMGAKLRNSFQVVLDKNQILAQYLANFLGSPYGQLRIEEAKSLGTGVVNHLSPAQIMKMGIAVPSLEVQQSICDFVNKLGMLRNTVNEITDNISLNPAMTKSLLPQLEEVLEVFKKLSDEDRIKALIRKGETKEIEFKQTFVLDVRQGIKNKDVTMSVIKTIAGFLNTDGGELLVGVDDAGEIVGVDEEMKKFYSGSVDIYKQNVRNAIRDKIGEQAYPFIDYDVHEVDSLQVLKVTCLRSAEPVFVGEEEFYVRTNPATDKLVGQKQLQYIRQRFG